MTKNEIISHIEELYGEVLRKESVTYANVNKSKNVWWLNIPIHKFIDDVHILLNDREKIYWIKLPKGFSQNVPFRIRRDKNCIDLEISADRDATFLRDVKSGGTSFDFNPFIEKCINKE